MAIKTPPGPALGPQIVGRAVNDLMPERAAATAQSASQGEADGNDNGHEQQKQFLTPAKSAPA